MKEEEYEHFCLLMYLQNKHNWILLLKTTAWFFVPRFMLKTTIASFWSKWTWGNVLFRAMLKKSKELWGDTALSWILWPLPWSTWSIPYWLAGLLENHLLYYKQMFITSMHHSAWMLPVSVNYWLPFTYFKFHFLMTPTNYN